MVRKRGTRWRCSVSSIRESQVRRMGFGTQLTTRAQTEDDSGALLSRQEPCSATLKVHTCCHHPTQRKARQSTM
ncbi:hypothetical protein GN956_G4597 [Arapaima gigas]